MQEMKNSNIPQNWKILKFKYAFSLNKGLTITKEDLRDEGVPCVNYGEIHSKYGFEVVPEKHLLKCVDTSYLETSQNMLLKQGEFVFADTSEDFAGIGNFTYLNSSTPTFAGYHTIIARLKKELYPRFFAYFFTCDIFRNQIRRKVSGIKVFSITQSLLKNTYLLLPPLNEQKQIVDYLDKKSTQIDTAIAKKETLIIKLQEYKKSLIFEAVTGKMEV